jgi:hypothetical protein
VLALYGEWYFDFNVRHFHEKPRADKPAKYDQTTEKRVLALLDQPAPKGYAQ